MVVLKYVGMASEKMAAVLNVWYVQKSALHVVLAFVSNSCHSRVFSSVTRLLALLKSTAAASHW